MTDTLIARLRCLNPVGDSFQYICKVTNEAADRIEALQAEQELAGKVLKKCMDECFELRAEVERLKSEREGIIQRSNEIISSLAAGAAPQQAEPKEQT